MNNILLLSMLGSGLAGLVFIIKLIVKNKFYRGWQYYIWFIVVLRFIMPIFPEISYTSTSKPSITPTYNQQYVNNNISNNINIETNTEITNKIVTKNNVDIIKVVTDLIPIIWVVGFTISLMLNMLFYIKFKQRVFNYNIDNNYISCILDDYKKQLNIKKKIYVFQNSYISTPMLIGFLKPVILVPIKNFSLEELTYIYKHELIHYKRFDMLIKHIINFTVCVHWFNPVVYILKNELNKCCELSCDEAVIKKLNKSECKIYGNIILKIAENNTGKNTGKNIPFASAMYEDKKILKERLISIMNFKQITKKAFGVSIALVLTVSIVAVFFGITFTENKTPLKYKILQRTPMPNRNNMTTEEIDFFSKFARDRDIEGEIKFSRPFSDSEIKKEISLHSDYRTQGLRPEKNLPIDDKTSTVYYDTAQKLFYCPDRELMDEEILQCIDFNIKVYEASLPAPKLTQEEAIQIGLNTVKNFYPTVDTSTLYVSGNYTDSPLRSTQFDFSPVLSEAKSRWILYVNSFDYSGEVSQGYHGLGYLITIDDSTGSVINMSFNGETLVFKGSESVDIQEAKKNNWIKAAEKVLKENLGEKRIPKDAFSYVTFDTETVKPSTSFQDSVYKYVLSNYINVVFEFEDNTSCIIEIAYPTGTIVGYRILSAFENNNNSSVQTRENINKTFDGIPPLSPNDPKAYMINEK